MSCNNIDRRALLAGAIGAALAAGTEKVNAQSSSPNLPVGVQHLSPLAGSVGVVLEGWKRTAFFKAAPGVSVAAFADQWIAEFGERLRRFPGLKSLILNTVNKERSEHKDFDFVTEMFFEDAASYLRAYGHEASLFTKEARVTGPSLAMVGRDVGCKELDKRRPLSKIKRFIVIQRKDGLTPEDLQRKWRDEHAWAPVLNPNIRKYFIHLADHEFGPTSSWDGYAEMWWDDWGDVGKPYSYDLPLPPSNAKVSLSMFLEPRRLV